MQTLQLTITLPDIVPFNDRAALDMQVLYVRSLVDAGTIDFDDPAQRDAVLSWYQQLIPYIQPDTEENEAAKTVLIQKMGWPVSDRPVDEILADVDAEMDRLEQANGWTEATYQQWANEHSRTTHSRP